MTYRLHIERETTPIRLDEWNTAVEATDGVRLQRTDLTGINPATGERIAIAHQEGDAELRFPTGESRDTPYWECIFTFWQGRVTFPAPDGDDPHHPVRVAATRLARALDASIVGDEGERYDW